MTTDMPCVLYLLLQVRMYFTGKYRSSVSFSGTNKVGVLAIYLCIYLFIYLFALPFNLLYIVFVFIFLFFYFLFFYCFIYLFIYLFIISKAHALQRCSQLLPRYTPHTPLAVSGSRGQLGWDVHHNSCSTSNRYLGIHQTRRLL